MSMHCKICGSSSTERKFKATKQPLGRYSLFSSFEGALSSNCTYKLDIAECASCHFAWNTLFDAVDINYEVLPILESASHAPEYIKFQANSANSLLATLGFEPSRVIEIGGGDGSFISKINAKYRIMYEPSRESNVCNPGIEVRKKYYEPNVDDVNADLIIMRQVLEHIQDPVVFLRTIIKRYHHESTFDDLYIYIEIPSYDQTRKFSRFADFYYEHCNYFSMRSLALLAFSIGAEIVELQTAYSDEILKATFRVSKSKDITTNYQSMINRLKLLIQRISSNNGRLALWGASGNGCTILRSLNEKSCLIDLVIDNDTRKQGLYIGGSGHKIVSPNDRKVLCINHIIIASQLHVKEITDQAREILGPDIKIFAFPFESI